MAFADDDEGMVDTAIKARQEAKLSGTRPAPNVGSAGGQGGQTSYGLKLPSIQSGGGAAPVGGSKQPEWLSGPAPSYSPGTPARRPRPSAGTGSAAPSPSGAQQAGLAARAVTRGGSSPLPTSPMGAVNTISSVARLAARPLLGSLTQSAREFGAGASGSASPVADFRGVRTASSSTASGASRGAPAPNGKAAPAMGGVSSATPPASASRPAATPQLSPGDVNTFTGSDGVTRAIAPAAAGAPTTSAPLERLVASRPDPIIAAASSAPQVQDSTDSTVAGVQRATLGAQNDAGALVTDAFSPTAEMMRRLQISQNSAFNAGSPSARAREAALITGQVDALNAASAAGQDATNDVLQGGAADENLANERSAERRQAARVATAGNDLQQQELQSNERVARRPQITTTASGGIGLIGDDASFTPVTDAAGNQVQAGGEETGRLGATDLLSAYTEQRAAILSGMGNAEDKAAQLAELDADPLYAQLRNGVAQGGTPGGQAGEAPPVPGARKAPDGQWYLQNDDGSYSVVTP
ncbi:MAG: hypothetical protein ACREO4_06100 [Lysobacter sp.]